jgi:O-antigen/teichoic acid export membrane protein
MTAQSLLRQMLPYALALAVSKALAFALLPLLTRALGPTGYAQWDLLATLADLGGLALGLGLADSLYRFTPTAPRTPARLLGLALTAAVVFLIVGQTIVALLPTLPFGVPRLALHALLASLALIACLEVPLAAFRYAGQSRSFALGLVGRALLQAGFIAVAALYDGGVTGLALATLGADILTALVLVLVTIRRFGIEIRPAQWRQPLRYGVPLAAGGGAGFVLGSCDRWFLVAVIPAASLAHYALAAKFALVVSLILQPFALWWYPRRIAWMETAAGRGRSAQAVGAGLLLLTLAVATTSLLGPLLVEALTPPSFHAAGRWIAPLALAIALNEAASLLNVGCYLGQTGAKPFLVNWLGAGVALIGYLLIAPLNGVIAPEAMAIVATLAAHGSRIALFLHLGRKAAPIPYCWWPIAAFAGLGMLVILGVPALGLVGVARGAVALAALALLAGLAAGLGWFAWGRARALPPLDGTGFDLKVGTP